MESTTKEKLSDAALINFAENGYKGTNLRDIAAGMGLSKSALYKHYKCKGDPWTKVCSSEDRTKASLDLLGGRKGLTGEFNYQTVCLHILFRKTTPASCILRKRMWTRFMKS